jgi:predicted DNA repair protein MutK
LVGAWLASCLPGRLVQVHSGLVRAVAVFGIYCLYVLLDDPMGFVINRPLQLLLGGFLAACLVVFVGKTVRPFN